jgi:hypothetical protein
MYGNLTNGIWPRGLLIPFRAKNCIRPSASHSRELRRRRALKENLESRLLAGTIGAQSGFLVDSDELDPPGRHEILNG